MLLIRNSIVEQQYELFWIVGKVNIATTIVCAPLSKFSNLSNKNGRISDFSTIGSVDNSFFRYIRSTQICDLSLSLE